jgi:hypothetical protein
MITTADINIGTRFGGEVDIPFEVELITNDLQMALGRIRGTALIDTEHTVRIDEDTHWYYRFVMDGTNQRVTLERLKLPDGADSMAFTDLETIDVEEVERGVVVEEYERALAQLMRRTKIRDEDGGLTTTHGDGILSAVFEKYGDYPDSEIKETEVVPYQSYEEIEEHFTRDEVCQLWRDLTEIDRIGRARATNLILLSEATELTDIRSELSDDDWEYINSQFSQSNANER